MTSPSASGQIEITASPETVFGLITDLSTLTACAEETAKMSWVRGKSAEVGAKFKGKNRNGWRRWSTVATITDVQPGSRFTFDVHAMGSLPVARWQYDIEPVGGGCRVTESTWDRRPGWFKKPAGLLTGIPDRTGANAAHIQATLQRLKQHAEASR